MHRMLNCRLFYASIVALVCLLLTLLFIPASVTAAEPRDERTSVEQTPTVPLTSLPGLAQIESELADERVVYVGEIHKRLEDHLIQLEIIRYLAKQDRPLAIGVEWFQQPFQEALNRYLAGKINERELLRATEYYERWGYDFRFYAPILRFARAHGIPVIALNVPEELTQTVARQGLDNLSSELRQWVPDTIDRTNAAYRRRLKRIYCHSHRSHGEFSFERFYTVQLLWDEGMAQRAAAYLKAHPSARMVILAGSGHLAYGSGIPSRVRRRTGIDGAIVLPSWEGSVSVGLADYLLLAPSQQLPEPGRLGVFLVAKEGQVIVHGFTENSSARAAGVKTDDVLLAINDQLVQSISDVRVALWNHPPGDVMRIRVRRTVPSGEERAFTFDITLH